MLGHTAISERAIGDASLGNDLFGASSQDLNFTQTTVGDLLFTEISPSVTVTWPEVTHTGDSWTEITHTGDTWTDKTV